VKFPACLLTIPFEGMSLSDTPWKLSYFPHVREPYFGQSK